MRYELTRPLIKLLDTPAADDPIDVLRREQEVLNELDEDALHTLALKAAERTADDRLKKEELETVSRIADEERSLAQQEQAYQALWEQISERRESVIGLKQALSRLR